MANIIWCGSGGDKHYKQLGFSSTMLDSYSVGGVDTGPSGITYDVDENVVWCGRSGDRHYKQLGFSTTMLGSYSISGVDSSPFGIGSDIDDNTQWCGTTDDKHYKQLGFSTTMLDSYSVFSIESSPTGITTDADENTLSCGSAGDKLYKWLGFSSTLTDSLAVTGIESAPTGITWDATGTTLMMWCGSNGDKLYQNLGFSSTMLDSVAVGGIESTSSGITIESFADRVIGDIPDDPRDPVRSLAIKASTKPYAVQRIRIKEEVTGWEVFSGVVYLVPYFKDHFALSDGTTHTILKRVVAVEVNGVALDYSPDTGMVSGRFYHNITVTSFTIDQLYVQLLDDSDPNDSTIIVYFDWYISDVPHVINVTDPTVDNIGYPQEPPEISPRLCDALMLKNRRQTVTTKTKEPYVGNTEISGGTITISDKGYLVRQMADKYIFEGSAVTNYIGYDDQDFSTYIEVSTSIITSPSFGGGEASFSTRSPFKVLDAVLPQYVFGTSDTFAFGAVSYASKYPTDTIGQPRPIAYGEFDETTAPTLLPIWIDRSFSTFAATYTTASVSIANVAETNPAYTLGVYFGEDAEFDEDLLQDNLIVVKSITVDISNVSKSDRRLAKEDNFWSGYYVSPAASPSNAAKVLSSSYDSSTDKVTFNLDVTDSDFRVTLTTGTTFNFNLHCPIVHFFIADHVMKEIDAIYVDRSGDEKEYSWMESDPLNANGWSGVVLPIPDYVEGTSISVRCSFKSKDIDGGTSLAKETLENHADVVKDILTNSGILTGAFSTGDLDASTFTAAKADRRAPLVLYLDSTIKALDVIDKIRRSVMSKMVFSKSGLITYTAWLPTDPSVISVVELTDKELIVGSMGFDSKVSDIRHKFTILYRKHGGTGNHLVAEYQDDITIYKFKVNTEKTLETYLRRRVDARAMSQRYVVYNRDIAMHVALTLPTTNTLAGNNDHLLTIGNYISLTVKEGVAVATTTGGVLNHGIYKKIFEIIATRSRGQEVSVVAVNKAGTNLNGAIWKDVAAVDYDDPTYDVEADGRGFWGDADGEVGGVVNISVWV